MMRRRSHAQVSTETLVRTICEIDRGTQNSRPNLRDQASICGRFGVASADRVHHARDASDFVSCWVELRADVLIMVESERKASKNCMSNSQFSPKTVTFATQVSPPDASFLVSPAMKAIASHLGSKTYLAVYGSGSRPCIWIAFDSKNDLDQWLKAIHDIVSERDGNSAWTSRQAAYKKLEPLTWRQLLSQAEQFWSLMDLTQEWGLGVSAAEVRGCEQLNGELELRITNTFDEANNGQDWEMRFCAISKNVMMIYPSEIDTIPIDIICLEFATITANRESLHAFNISTPVMSMELRAPNDRAVDKWTDAIFAIQSSSSFNALVPRSMVRGSHAVFHASLFSALLPILRRLIPSSLSSCPAAQGALLLSAASQRRHGGGAHD